MSVYVEILIAAPIDTLWAHTQTPALHERWDLRFSRIDYLPKTDQDKAQQFLYTTRIGFGIEVRGEGETVGHRGLPDGSRSSALKFASRDPISIIREGSGYWKYIPTSEGTRFLTSYDYRTRFGRSGALFDRVIFRPLIGWATAWSFDRLRLWLERSVDPAQSRRQTAIHSVARIALAAIVAGHGAVAIPVATTLLIAWCRRWPIWLCVASIPLFTIILLPGHHPSAYEAVLVAALAAIDLLVLSNVPSAARCRRRPRGGNT